jgi:hypothetical protein
MAIGMRVAARISVLGQHCMFSDLVLSSEFLIDMARRKWSAPRWKLKLYIPGLD